MFAKPGTVCLLLFAAGWLHGCSSTAQPPEHAGLMPKLSLNSYIEEGNLVALAVSVRPATIRPDENYVAFEFAIVNKGLASLTIDRESITLVDDEGRRYPLAGPEELYSNYVGVDRDRRFAELAGFIAGRFQTSTLLPSNFTPTFENGVVQDRVPLHRNSYIVDYAYFPRPKNGVAGQRFELSVVSPELPDPVFVRFAVPGKTKPR